MTTSKIKTNNDILSVKTSTCDICETEDRKNGIRRSHHFPRNTSQLTAIIFETSKRIGQSPTLSLVRGSVGRERVTRGRCLSSHHGERRPRQKQESTCSVPLRGGEDTTDSVPSKGVSFRVVSGTSVTIGVVSLLRCACL